MSQDPHAAPMPIASAHETHQNSAEARTSFHSNSGTSSGTCYDEDDADISDAMQPLMFEDEKECIKKRSWVYRAAWPGYRWHVPYLSRLPWNIHKSDINDTSCPSTTPTKPAQSSTGWLDGLRGVACLMVVFHHSNIMFEPFSPVNPTRNVLFLNLRWFVTLPFWKIWYAGPGMVAIFFVVSGFSISFSSLGHSRRQSHEKVLQSLSSSTFRRWMRLHIPTLVVTFGDMLASYAGLYNGTGDNDRHRQPPKFDDFSAQFWDWWGFWRQLSNPFQMIRPTYPALPYGTPYDPNVWTIPIEYQGSMVVFIVILALASLRRNARLALLTGIVWLMFHDDELSIVLFLGGTLLADMHYAREEWKDKLLGGIMPEPESSSPAFHRSFLRKCKRHAANIARFFTVTVIGRGIISLFWTTNFIVALYNISKGDASIDYRTAASAIHLVFTIDNAKFLQPIFTTRLAKFLGKISFSLYLIHGAFLHTLGWHLWTVYTANWIGDNTAWQHLTATTVAAVPVYIVTIIVARFLSWVLDDKSVQFARWLWTKLKV